jgi:hypothetical protein
MTRRMLFMLFSRTRTLLLLSTSSALLAVPAAADVASLELEQSVTGHTNLFRTADDEEADGSYEIRPRLRFRRPVGPFQYLVEYSPTYELYFESDGIDGFDQFGRAELSYSPAPSGVATLNTDLAYYRSIRSETVDGPGGIPEVVPDVSGRVFRGLADVGYEHSFSATTTAQGTLGLQSYEYTSENNADSFGVGGELSFLHELRPAVALGGLAFASHRRFDDQLAQPSSDNTVLHLAPTLRLAPTPTLVLDLQAGPAWIRTDRDSAGAENVSRFRTVASGSGTDAAVFDACGTGAGQPLLSQCPLAPTGGLGGLLVGQTTLVDYPSGRPPSGSDDTLTAFARAELRQQEDWGYASLEYFRSEDASSASGATSVRDSVTAAFSLDAGTRWSFRLRGNWNQRETVDRIPRTEVIAGPSPVFAGGGVFFAEAEGLVVVERTQRTVTQVWTDARLQRRITHALSAEIEVRYLYQDRDGSGPGADSFDDWRGTFMLSYSLPTIEY